VRSINVVGVEPFRTRRLVLRMDRERQEDRRQEGEHERLDERHEDLEEGKKHHRERGQGRNEASSQLETLPKYHSEPEDRRDHRVTREHVRKETNGERRRPNDVRRELDHYHERDDEGRHVRDLVLEVGPYPVTLLSNSHPVIDEEG